MFINFNQKSWFLSISWGSCLASFLQLKSLWNHFQNHSWNHFLEKLYIQENLLWKLFCSILATKITLKSLFGEIFQENIFWTLFCSIFATKIALKSLSKSLWNHFLGKLSRKISSGSCFAPFLHFEIRIKITLKSLFGENFQENLLWKLFCYIFAAKINLKSFSKSLWNHFLEKFSRKISSGSCFAPFLQLKSLSESLLKLHFGEKFPGKSLLEAVLLHFCILKLESKSLWNHFLEKISRKISSGSCSAHIFAAKITLKSFSKSLWNHFLEKFSRKISSGSCFAPFLQLKSLSESLVKLLFGEIFQENLLWKLFCSIFAAKIVLKSLSKSLWNHFLGKLSRKISSGSCFAPFLHFEIRIKITLKFLFGENFQENLLWKLFCSIFATKITLKSLWKSLLVLYVKSL